MPMRLGANQAFGISLGAHAAIGAALATYLAGGPVRGEPGPLMTGISVPVAVEEPAPLPPEEPPPRPRVRPRDDPAVLVEATDPDEAVDPRFAEIPAAVPAGIRADRGAIGIGAGRFRVRARRAEAPAPAAAAEPSGAGEPAPGPEAVPAEDGAPTVRARAIPGSCPAPEYPARERRLGVEGLVEIRVAVAADGSVGSADVARSSGSAALDRAALAAVLGWRFEPALLDGVAVADAVLVPVRFVLVSAALSREE